MMHDSLDRSSWGMPLKPFVCESCDWIYLVSENENPELCPHCFQNAMSPTAEEELLIYPPELILPFSVDANELTLGLERFSGGIPFAPRDLSASNLVKRWQAIYLPMWLVDVEVEAIWWGEAGFDYEVVSYQDRFNENTGGWSSRRVKETRARWEPRAGKLNRIYENIHSPALREEVELKRQLGVYDNEKAISFRPNLIKGAFIRLPDRNPEDSWKEAIPTLMTKAEEECRIASKADHFRDFRWNPTYDNLHWTQMLLPLYSTYYRDDEGKPRSVLIHGRTGRMVGERFASMSRAQRVSMIILAVAAVVFFFSLGAAALGFIFQPTLLVGGVGVLLAVFIALSAIYPVVRVWLFNRR